MGDVTLSLDCHCRNVDILSSFYKYYHKITNSPKASFARNTRFSNIQHPFAITLVTNLTNAFANMYIVYPYS